MKKTYLTIFILGIIIISLTGCNSSKKDSKWKNYKNIYMTQVTNTGEDDDVKYLEIAKRSKKLIPILENKVDAFIMDADNYSDIDGHGTPLYTENKHNYPVEIDPYGQSIEVSKNYFKQNPINSSNGTNIIDNIIYSDDTMNLLVPEKYKKHEKEIIAAYADLFYFQLVNATHFYNEKAGITETLHIEKSSLKINIIYVKDNQKYFTFQKSCAVKTNNYITDPVVRIYTSNIHSNYAHSKLSQWLFFPSEKISNKEAYQDILPYLKEVGAEKSVQKVISVYENCKNN